MAAPTVQQIRQAMAANLSTLHGIQVSGYMLANPTPPCVHLWPTSVDYDLTFQRGYDTWFFTVQAFVALSSDIGSQVMLDQFIAPSGPQSVKAVLEADDTLGGLVVNLSVTNFSNYDRYIREGGGPVLGANWSVEIIAPGK
jgi:hypothetical protein